LRAKTRNSRGYAAGEVVEVGFLLDDAGGVFPVASGAFAVFDGAEAGLAAFGGFLPVEQP
jgi:hypothetical protein